jgi:hypothetical protein
LEHVSALFRTFRINETERKIVQHRAAPLANRTQVEVQVQNGERWISALENKAGVLLTHISMMIAVTGLMLAISNDSLWYEVVLACELAAYLLLALLCIRCQNHYGTNEFYKIVKKGPNPQDGAPHHVYQNAVFGELLYREWLFRIIQWALYLLTFLLILTVFYGLLADEFGLFLE